MLLHHIFIHCFSIVLAGSEISNLSEDFSINDNPLVIQGYQKDPKEPIIPARYQHSCEQMSRTSYTPFVVIVLLKTSGRFLGMGSIIDKKTILTSAKLVDSAMHNPKSILILAGRLSPWWGKDAQVRKVSDLYQNDMGLALIILKKQLKLNKNIKPINLPAKPTQKNEEFTELYGEFWAVFGIPRSSWDIPGDYAAKSSMYVMKIESSPAKKDDYDACKARFPDVDFNETVHGCTWANGSFYWGCVGSPVVSVNKANKLLQIGTIIRASTTETDDFHVLVKVAHFDTWIRSHSLVGFEN